MSLPGLASNSLGVSDNFVFTPSTTKKFVEDFNFFVRLKLGQNESRGPTEQFPQGLRLFYSNTFDRKHFVEEFNFFVWLKEGLNESPGASKQFPWGLRQFHFHRKAKTKFC